MSTPLPSRSDRGALILAIVLGIGVVGYTLFEAVIRSILILGNTNVPVVAAFDDMASLAVLPDGGSLDVVASQAIVSASGMDPVTVTSLLLAEIISALAVSITVVCTCLVLRNIIRGEAFGRANVVLVGTATFAVAGGWVLNWLFTTMGANGALAALGAPTANVPFPVEPVTVFAIAALGGLSTAFVIGHRLQNETEGLV
ncbi:hypothetical protein [Antiquaquibacter soli]|uniref:DUF2975 domain-containing protein n=1 Tax=Antiquaquibacter soli TaxID=3064523 RepID=A0ABT9BNU0_9MICO|nr:hypothetical protein [Protaetiibacter sp. WY-16]MDO7882680.1 hypothetical protein [Protaetiibacter sp. WY-16]